MTEIVSIDFNGNESERLNLDIEGWEGPLDVLLHLARAQKVDLARISILELVEQYLVFTKFRIRVTRETVEVIRGYRGVRRSCVGLRSITAESCAKFGKCLGLAGNSQ